MNEIAGCLYLNNFIPLLVKIMLDKIKVIS